MSPRTGASYASLSLAVLAVACHLPPSKLPQERPPICPSSAAGDRTIVFVSDLHVGVGAEPGGACPIADSTALDERIVSAVGAETLERWRDEACRLDGTVWRDDHPGCEWHSMEDFRWDHDFERFLNAFEEAPQAAAAIDLVILGDFLELWQSPWVGCAYKKSEVRPADREISARDLGCPEGEALCRTVRVISQHQPLFDALAAFAAKGDNRVVVVPGNHDIALTYPRVRDLVEAALGGRPRARVATEGYWRSADGLVYAEHGHQIGADANRFDGWPNDELQPPVWKDSDGTAYLQRSFGEQLVQEFFNRWELRYPIVDNLAEELDALKFGRRVGGLPELLEGAGTFLRFFVTQTSARQRGAGLGEPGDPSGWDIEATRARYETGPPGAFLLESLPPDDALRTMVEQAVAAGEAVPAIADLSEDEIRQACQFRWAARQRGENVGYCESDESLRAAASKLEEKLFPGARNEKLRAHLEAVGDALPDCAGAAREFELFVYGHTHDEEKPFPPFAETASSEDWQPLVVNDGAWQRGVTLGELCTIARRKQLDLEPDADFDYLQGALDEVAIEDLPACYPFVKVTYGTGKPVAEVLYWDSEYGEETPFCGIEVANACEKEG